MENFEKYRQKTLSKDWAGICELNGVEFDTFGTKKELKVLGDYLENGEVVFALTSGVMEQTETSNSFDFGTNTWLVALTNERILLLDCAMLTSSVDTQSIRLERVQAVSSSQGWVFGKIMIDLGSRMAVLDNSIKATVSVFADLANKLLREMEQQKKSGAPVSDSNNGQDDLLGKLERLAALRSSGVLSEDEFNTAKAKILAAL